MNYNGSRIHPSARCPLHFSHPPFPKTANGNPNHFVIATQDRQLQKRIMREQGGAVIFSSSNGLGMETPSALQQGEAAFKEAKTSRPSKAERETLKKVAAHVDLEADKRKSPRRLTSTSPCPPGEALRKRVHASPARYHNMLE